MRTPLQVVPKVEPYLPAFAEGVDLFAQAKGTKPERVDTVAAFCLRESWAGFAPGYRPKGSPDGTGDWTARVGHWTQRAGVRVIADAPAERERLRRMGWSLSERGHEESLILLPRPASDPKVDARRRPGRTTR